MTEDDRATEELRLLALGLLDRAEPGLRALLARMQEPAPAADHPSTCTWCPLCTAVGLLRGERPELAAALAQHADGLITTLRAALSAPAHRDDNGPAPPRVQRIEVRPAGGADSGC